MSELAPEVVDPRSDSDAARHKAELMAYNEEAIRNDYAQEEARGKGFAKMGNVQGLAEAPDNMFTQAADASARLIESDAMSEAIARGNKETANAYDEVKLAVDHVRQTADAEGLDQPYQKEAKEKVEKHLEAALANIGATGDKPFAGFGAGHQLTNDHDYRMANGEAHIAGDSKRTKEEFLELNTRQHGEWVALQEKQRAERDADLDKAA